MSIVKKTKIQQAVSETTANQTHKLEEQRMYTQTMLTVTNVCSSIA